MRRVAADIVRLCAFDLHRNRGLAAAVVAMEAGRAAIAESVLRLPMVTGFREADVLGAFGQVAVGAADTCLWLLALVATAIVVQIDPPSDDRAVWRTRPIPPVTLAAAKIGTLAILLVIVPVAINTLRLAAYGAPIGAIGAAAIQIAVLAGFAVVPAWPLAIATRTAPRFCALALVVLVLLVIAWARFTPPPIDHQVQVHDGFRFGFPMPALDWRRHDLHGWWTGVAFVLAGLGVIVGHYATRRIAVSVPLGTVLALAVVTWPITRQQPRRPRRQSRARSTGRWRCRAGSCCPTSRACATPARKAWMPGSGVASRFRPCRRILAFAVHLGPGRIRRRAAW